jgi:ketosteroid isomerase-like protein
LLFGKRWATYVTNPAGIAACPASAPWYDGNMTSHQQFLQELYDAFNKREFETVLSMMEPDVKWANGMEGGFVYGRDAVRGYWRKQFEVTQGQLEPLKYEIDENNRSVVTVHLTVKDLQGNLLVEKTVDHIFTIENGLIGVFEIGDSEPLRLIKSS